MPPTFTVACDAGVGEVDVVDFGTAAYQSEEALVAVGIAAAGLVDADAADGVAVAVEITIEFVDAVVVSYGLIVALSFVEGQVVGVERNVGSELEELAPVCVCGLAVSAVHAVGEQQELVFVVYHVGVVCRVALVHGCPVDGGEGGGVDADGHVLVGHGECGAAEGACAGGVGVLVAGLLAYGAGREGEAELVVAAVVEGLAALQSSAAVGGDAADGVLGRRAGEGDGADGDVGVGGDGVRLLAGCCDAGGRSAGGCYGVIDICDGGCGSHVVCMDGYGVEADVGSIDAGGGEDVVLEYQCVAVAPSLQTAGVIRFAGERTSEGAASDGEFALETVADDATQVAIVITHDADIGGYEAVLYGVLHAGIIATGEANQTCRVSLARHAASNHEVSDGSAFDFAEGRGALYRAGDADGERIAAAVEGAGELVVAAARHARDGDVSAELDGLAAGAVVGVVVIEGGAHDAPSGGAADGVGVAADGEVVAGGEADVVDGGFNVAPDGAGDAVVDVVAVADGASTGGIAYDGADIAIACDGAAEVDAVLDGAGATACDAAVIFATDGGGDAGGAGAAGDGAVIVAYDAAVVVGIGCNGVDGDVAEDVAVLYTTVVVAYDGAAVVVAGEAGVGEEYVLHLGNIAELSEESRVSFLGFTAALVDADTADGVAPGRRSGL